MAVAAPIVLVPFVIGSIVVLYVRMKCTVVNQTLEWLESECRGPINTKFSSIMDGLVTVRAYQRQEYFIETYMKEFDKVSCVSMTYYGVNIWFLGTVDYIGAIVSVSNAVGVYFIAAFTNLVGSVYLSLSILTSTSLPLSFSFIVLTYVTMENQMKLVKNAMNYAEMDTEDDLVKDTDSET